MVVGGAVGTAGPSEARMGTTNRQDIPHRADICYNTRMSFTHTHSAGVRRIKAVIGNLA